MYAYYTYSLSYAIVAKLWESEGDDRKFRAESLTDAT